MTLMNRNGQQPREAFYGGAAGGGKSEALLMGAAQYVEVPGYSALILRKALPDLNQANALIPRSHEWWAGSAARWHENKKIWTFPSGAAIRFGYLERDADLKNYMGSEYQFIGYDEATQFPFHLYRYLLSRLRKRRGMDVPLRVRCASNPGGVGHEWVKERFLSDEALETGKAFVPAKLNDNPTIDEEEYRDVLNELDPVTRAQLLDGDWNVAGTAGNFKRAWFELLDAMPSEFERIVRYWDTASVAPQPGHEDKADYTVGTLMGRRPGGKFVVMHVSRMQGNPADVEAHIKNQAAIDDVEWNGAVEIYMEQEPGASGKSMIESYQTRVLPGYYFEGVRSTGPKPVRAAAFSSQAKAGNVQVVRGEWNLQKWFDELEAFPFGMHDDQVDSSSGAFNKLALGGEVRLARRSVANMFSWRS